MTLDQLVSILGEKEEHIFQGTCIDCKCPVEVAVRFEGDTLLIKGGAIHKYYNILSQSEETQYKCDRCYEKKPYFQSRVDKYSRIVGYLRPVNDWNDAKLAEFHNRKHFLGGINEFAG